MADNLNLFSDNPLFSGSFITGQFIPSFVELLAQQRLAVLVEIEAKPTFSVIPLGRSQPSQVIHDLTRDHYYSLNSSGVVQRSDSAPPSNATLDKDYVTGPPVPNYLIFSDENGASRYVTVNTSTLALQASGTFPSQFTAAQGHFCGAYLRLIDNVGTGIWHMTVNSSNVISTALQATEAKRIQPVRLSHGHPSPIDESDQFWAPALISFGDVRSSIPQTDGGYAGISTPSFGEMQIEIVTDEFKFLAEQGWDTRLITVWAGKTTDLISEYPVIFRAQSSRAESSLNTLTVTMRDSAILFNNSFQESYYTGAGGYEGSAQLEGVLFPLCYGQAVGATPLLIDEDINLYQVHGGPIHGIYDVFTGGARLSYGGDLLGLADLRAWTPTQADVDAGRWRSDEALGVFRLASRPTAPITVDFGGSTSVPEFEYSVGHIIQAIIADKLPRVTLDANSMSAFIARWPRTYGVLYKTQETSIGDVLSELVEPMGAVIALTRLNELRIMMVERGAVRAYIQSNSVVESGSSPRRREPPTPGLTYRVGGRKLTTLNETDILANADAYDRQFLLSPVSFASYTLHASDSKRYDSAGNIEKVISTHDPLARRKILYNMVHRDYFLQSLYEITVMGYLYQFELGDTVILEIPEIGINQPKTGIIIAITERSPTRTSEDMTDLLVWTN